MQQSGQTLMQQTLGGHPETTFIQWGKSVPYEGKAPDIHDHMHYIFIQVLAPSMQSTT